MFSLILLVLAVVAWNYYQYVRFEKERKLVNGTDGKPSECLSNKNVVITGASSGIGLQLARHYAAKGKKNKLVLAARNIEQLEKIKSDILKEFQDNSPEVFCVKTDVSVEDECKQLIEQSLQLLNERIDVIYLNAGRSSVQTLKAATSLDGHRSLMETNFFGCVAPTFYLLPHLREKQQSHCAICVVSSLAGLNGVPYRTAYSSSKFALHGFYEALKLELMQEGIYGKKVSLFMVCPGFVQTEIHFNALGTENKDRSSIKRDLKEFMTVEECVDRMVTNVEGRYGSFLYIVPYTERFLLQYIRPWMPSFLIDKIVLSKGGSVQIESDKSQ